MRDRLILLAATFTLICNVPAIAQTPDGETPAVETDCDILVGATPGLYGLCVAFCEAHDADLLTELDVPNRNILRNYDTLRGDSDPVMPCLEPDAPQVPCPCWSADELLEVLPPETNFDANFAHACDDSPNRAVLESVVNGLTDTRKFKPPAIQLVTGTNSDATYCLVVNMDYPGGPPSSDNVINANELQTCKALLVARANEARVDGQVWDCF